MKAARTVLSKGRTCRLEQDGGLTVYRDGVVAEAYEPGETVRLARFLSSQRADQPRTNQEAKK